MNMWGFSFLMSQDHEPMILKMNICAKLISEANSKTWSDNFQYFDCSVMRDECLFAAGEESNQCSASVAVLY